MKIEKSNLDETAKIMNWLIQNVGPRTPNSGSILHGLGWSIRSNPMINTYIIELNEHVDDETVLLFMLKWS